MDSVYLFLVEGMADWEPGFALAELNTGRFFRPGAPRLAVRTCALSPGTVTSMGGLRIQPDLALAEVSPARAAMLILPGSEAWLAPGQEAAIAKAREFLDAGVPVAAICGATVGLARAGLLDAREHTSNAPGFLAQFCPEYRGAAFYCDAPAVSAGGLITASGAAALDFAVEILRRLGVFSPETLEAWRDLHRSGEPRHIHALLRSLGQG